MTCLPRHCLRFLQTCNQIWEGLETYRHGVLSKTEWCPVKQKNKRKEKKCSRTHSTCCARLWENVFLKKKYPPQQQFPCTMKNVPITNTVVMSLNLFVLSYCSGVVSFSGNPASIKCDGTHVSFIGGQNLLLLAFETTPAPRDNWVLKGYSPGLPLLVPAWISWCL